MSTCTRCGVTYGGHTQECPRNPNPRPQPNPDPYVSPHALDYSNEKPVKIPVFEYVQDSAGVIHAHHKDDKTAYPHRQWVKARDLYAKNPELCPLDTVLAHVTETNPPPGPPIVVYKPAIRPAAKFSPRACTAAVSLVVLLVVLLALGALL